MQSTRFLGRYSAPHVFTLVIISGLGALAMNLFLPSLPAISLYFNEDKAVVQLTISLYLFAVAFLQLFLGPFSDFFGRRPVVLFGISVFIIGTLVCIYAPNVETLLLGRALQAFSAAGQVIGRAAIRDMVSSGKAASMIGYVTMGMTLAPMVGPVVGGYLGELYGWQAPFWLLLSVGVLVFVITFADMGETRKVAAPNLTSQFLTYPILFRSRRFWGYSLTAMLCSGAFFSLLGGGPYVATEFFKLTPGQFGLFFMFISVGYMTGNFLSGKFAQNVGIGRMMIYGNFVLTAGIITAIIANMLFPANPLSFFLPLTCVGLGNGITLPSAHAGIVSTRPEIAGAASGLGGFLGLMGGGSLSMLAGIVLGPGSNPIPLLMLMLVTSLLAICSTQYVAHIDRVELAHHSTAD